MSVTHTSASQPATGRNRRLLALPILALALIGCVLLARRGPTTPPRLVARAQTQPLSIRRYHGAWYWLEKPAKGANRLVRAESTAQPLTSAEALTRYDLEGEQIAWIAREGRRWTITLAALDGGNPRVLWSGEEEPFGLKLVKERVYWLHRLPAPVTDCSPLPPLMPTLEILSVPREGGAPTPVAHLDESEDGDVLGFYEGALTVVAYRRGVPGSKIFYKVPADGTAPVRLLGERGVSPPLLTQGGVLYWLAPSAEATSAPGAYCLRRLDKTGRPETLSDWLPAEGRLYETTRGVLDGDQGYPGALWFEGTNDAFPRSVPLPPGYTTLAAGEDQMLLYPAYTSISSPTLYQAPLP